MKTRFERMFDKLKTDATSPSDLELVRLFKKHEAAISEHYESCIPALDGSDYWKYTPTKDYPLSHFHGPLFHKGFRQHDITSSAADDMRIWNLLSGMGDVPQADAFWDAHDASMRTRLKTAQTTALPGGNGEKKNA